MRTKNENIKTKPIYIPAVPPSPLFTVSLSAGINNGEGSTECSLMFEGCVAYAIQYSESSTSEPSSEQSTKNAISY